MDILNDPEALQNWHTYWCYKVQMEMPTPSAEALIGLGKAAWLLFDYQQSQGGDDDGARARIADQVHDV